MYIDKIFSLTIKKSEEETGNTIEIKIEEPKEITLIKDLITYYQGKTNLSVFIRQLPFASLFTEETQLIVDGIFIDSLEVPYRCCYDLLSGMWLSQEKIKRGEDNS